MLHPVLWLREVQGLRVLVFRVPGFLPCLPQAIQDPQTQPSINWYHEPEKTNSQILNPGPIRQEGTHGPFVGVLCVM